MLHFPLHLLNRLREEAQGCVLPGPGFYSCWGPGDPGGGSLFLMTVAAHGHSEGRAWHHPQASYHTRRVGLGQPVHFGLHGPFLDPVPRGQGEPRLTGRTRGQLCAVSVHLRPRFYKVSQEDETPVMNLK